MVASDLALEDEAGQRGGSYFGGDDRLTIIVVFESLKLEGRRHVSNRQRLASSPTGKGLKPHSSTEGVRLLDTYMKRE